MAGTSGLLELAQFIVGLTPDDLRTKRVSLEFIQQRAQSAINQYLATNVNGRYRQGLPGSFPGERPRFVYLTTPAPGVPAVNDNYVFDAGSSLAAETVVTALNAMP